MNKLVDDLLLLSRLDSGRLELSHKVVELGLLLKAKEGQFLKLTTARNIALVVVEAQGGKIVLQSQVGIGTEVILTFMDGQV